MARPFHSRSDDAGSYRAAPPNGEADPIPEALYDVLQSPSLFERILLIAALRSSATDDPREAVDPDRSQTPEIERALSRLHLQMFYSWLALSLQRQKADIGIYLN